MNSQTAKSQSSHQCRARLEGKHQSAAYAETGSPIASLGRSLSPTVAGDVNQAIGALIDKVSATSIAEFEKLIGELETTRNYLKSEGDRIQQEMVRYAHLSEYGIGLDKNYCRTSWPMARRADVGQDGQCEPKRDAGIRTPSSSLETVAENVTFGTRSCDDAAAPPGC